MVAVRKLIALIKLSKQGSIWKVPWRGWGRAGVSAINNMAIVMSVVICVLETTVNNLYRLKTIR